MTKKATKAKAAKPLVKAGTSKEAAAARKATFVEEYIANKRNGEKAAIAAGFSPKTAAAQASRLLKDVKVQEMLSARSNELAEKHELTTESVIAELSKIVHADPRRLFGQDGQLLPVSEWPDGLAGAIASVEVDELFEGQGAQRKFVGYTKKVKLWDKNSAIDKAMKHLGLFEADNKQRAGALADLPREMVKAIVERLKQMNAGNGKSARLDR